MRKNSKLVPSALKHGIYSAIGLLPTEDPAEFEKFKLEIFDDYKPTGRSEIIIVEEARAGTAEHNLFQIESAFTGMVSTNASRFRT